MKYWLFYFLKSFLALPIRVFARHIYLDGLENIPKDKPVLLSSNHPNSFLDGIIYEYLLRRYVYTMVRGDMFLKPLPNKLLRSMRLLPIFRARDAHASIARKGNDTTLDECYELFKKNRLILIFSEGDSWPEKHVRRFKNGTTNMALDLYEKGQGQLDLYVLPCGLNYTSFGIVRRDIHLSFGSAIRIADHAPHNEDEKRSIAAELTKDLHHEVSKLVVQTKGEKEEVKEMAQEIALNDHMEPSVFIRIGSNATDVIRAVDKADDKVRVYMDELKKLRIQDRNVAGNGFNYPAIFLALITALVSLPAFVLYLITWMIGGRMTKKMVKSPVFIDSIYFGFGVVGTILVVIGIMLFSFLAYNTLWAWIVSMSAISGMIAWFNTLEETGAMVSEIRYLSLKKETQEKLKAMRASLFV